MKAKLPYTELADALDLLGSPEEASEFHGTLCGALCVREAAELDPIELIDAEAGEVLPDAQAEALIRSLCEYTIDSLTASDMGFAPLLPGDDVPLGTRTQALALWCQGFLYGLSSQRRIDLTTLTDEAREIINDISQFTQAGLEADDDEELEEGAYVELVEYIRVGAQLLFLELHANARSGGSDPGHPTLH